MEMLADQVVLEMIQYLPHSVQTRTIAEKLTGHITAFSFDAGERLQVKTIPFDSYIQIVDGSAELTVNAIIYRLEQGHFIIVPAHEKHSFHANVPFKMLITVIKSGYEE